MIEILFLFLSATAVVDAEVFREGTAEWLKQRQIDWVRSREGAFVSEKVGVVPPPGHPEGAGGLFALDKIEKGEKIFFIPSASVLKPYDEAYPDPSFCDAAERLVDEYELGEEGEFWPYVQYVFESFPHEHVPYAWSQEGKDLVHNIIGRNLLEPQGFGEFEPCEGFYDEETRVLMDAALRIVIARGWHHVLVPAYDMANHNNGKGHNMDQLYDSYGNDELFVVALRDIERGEQLCLSYNQCNDSTCEGADMTHVTQHLFLEYGFIEQFPQRWLFNIDDDEEDFVFEVEQDETKSNSLQVTWLTGEPSDEELRWFELQYKRLSGMRDLVLYQAEQLEASHEGRAAVEFYESLTRAIELAMNHAKTDNTTQECSVSSISNSTNSTTLCAGTADEKPMESSHREMESTVVSAVVEDS